MVERTLIEHEAETLYQKYEERFSGEYHQELNGFSRMCHELNQKWWHDLESGKRLDRNKGELLALIHSEVSECLEGVRKNLDDDKLPWRKMEEVELADTLIRIFDYAGAYNLDLMGALMEKCAYNQIREDHKAEARLAENGKKF